ncbi:MAG: hypothetical protein JXX28_09375 [Deltaproteobacteria bacterium]|nr:hypothetical protein [Deltaproteobacteria bacterium]
MKAFKFVVLAAVSTLALAGCDPESEDTSDTSDTSDTNVEDCTGVETLIMNIDFSCDDTAGWDYWATTQGMTGAADVKVDQNTASPWHEEHTLVSVNSGEADADHEHCWDEIERNLVITSDYAAQVSDTNSLFTCDMHDLMMFELTVYDAEMNKADCAVWGSDVSIYDADGCLNWNPPAE